MSERFRPKWSGSLTTYKGATVPVQAESTLRGFERRKLQMPEPIARLAYEEYARQYGTSQSFERLHERGGFGLLEIISLLADSIEREKVRRET